MAIHTEYSLRHKVEFILDELAENPRLTANKAIRIICAPNKYGIGDEQTWNRSYPGPKPNHAHLPLYVIDHSAVHISLTPFAGAGPDTWQLGIADIDIFAFAGSQQGMFKAVDEAVEAYDAWLNGEVYTLVYRERGTNVRIKTDEGVYGYVNAVQTSLAELDRLDAVRPYQLRLPGVPEVRHADAV